MKDITLDLPPEILDALEHLGGRNKDEICRIVSNALRNEFRRRARPFTIIEKQKKAVVTLFS